jgi:hypothetical protein
MEDILSSKTSITRLHSVCIIFTFTAVTNLRSRVEECYLFILKYIDLLIMFQNSVLTSQKTAMLSH